MGDNAILNASDFLGTEEGLLSFMMGNIHNAITNQVNRVFSKYDLTLRQVLVISYLFNHEKDIVTQKTLEDCMHLSNPTITVLIQNMCKKGLIKKEKVPEDGRKYRLTLTQKTKDLCAEAFAEMTVEEQNIFAGVTPEEKRQLRHVLEKIEGNLGFSSTGKYTRF